MTVRKGPTKIKPYSATTTTTDAEVDLCLSYAVRGFQSTVLEQMSFRDIIGKLHLYECIVTREQPTSVLYNSLNETTRQSNLKLLAHLDLISLPEDYNKTQAELRIDLERKLFNALTSHQGRDSIVLWQHFLRIAQKSHHGVPPAPDRVGLIKQRLDALHNKSLEKQRKLFSAFTSKVQNRLLHALGRDSAQGIPLGQNAMPWFNKVRLHLKQLSNPCAKQKQINTLIDIRKSKVKNEILTCYNAINRQHKLEPQQAVPKPVKHSARRKLFS